MQVLPRAQSYATWLGIVRIFTGIIWLLHGVPKLLNPNFAGPDGMAGMVQEAATHNTSAYGAFLTHVVLPNAALFAHLVAWGETLTGVSLLLGLFTRVGGFFGVFLPLNYWAMKMGWATTGGWSGLDMTTLALSFVNLVLPTGLALGLDGLIAARRSAPRVNSGPES